MMQLLQEISQVIDVPECTKTMKYAVFKDNFSTLELAKAQKIRPYTNHTTIKYHYFRSFLDRGLFQLEGADTAEKQDNFLTKPLAEDTFACL